MKEILIRLEDELYEQCKNTELTEENEGFDFHIIKSVANGTPLSEELGSVKAEINQYITENKNSEDLYLAGCGDGAYHALCMLNKHFPKLKEPNTKRSQMSNDEIISQLNDIKKVGNARTIEAVNAAIKAIEQTELGKEDQEEYAELS